MPLKLQKNSVLHSQGFTHGNFWINHSLSQESEDINSYKRTWTCSSTSKTILTPTSPTLSTSPTSSRLVRLLLLTFSTNTVMVNSLIQLQLTQETRSENEEQVAELKFKN